jgi:hypothetical protein
MNKWYVYFDNDFKILSVTNELSKNDIEYFEISEDIALEFTSGIKSISSYKVKINNLTEFILEPIFKPIDNSDKFIDSRTNDDLVFKDISVVKENILDPHLTIIHDTNKWIFSISQELKQHIPHTQHDKILKFFIVNRFEINLLYRKIDIKIKDLLEQDQIINFADVIEEYYDKLLIISTNTIDKITILKNE